MATREVQTNTTVPQANSVLTLATSVAKNETEPGETTMKQKSPHGDQVRSPNRKRVTMTKQRSTNCDLITSRGCEGDREVKPSEDKETIFTVNQAIGHRLMDAFSPVVPSTTPSRAIREQTHPPCARLHQSQPIAPKTLSRSTIASTLVSPSSECASQEGHVPLSHTTNLSFQEPIPPSAPFRRSCAPSSGRCWGPVAVIVGVLALAFVPHCEAARGRQVTCVCTTNECQEAGVPTCVTESLCYAQLLDMRDGTHPITRGCFLKRQTNPLLCMNQPPAIDLDRWPYLICCSTDFCNSNVNPTVPPQGSYTRHTSESGNAIQSIGVSSVEDAQPQYSDTSSIWLHVTYLCVITVALTLMIVISGAGLHIVRKYRLQEAQNKFGYEAPEAVVLT
ncbi:uncharacterized protein LOC143024848 [Oratosquilla oratoria]|uniref:uncharacterized protein LOC143024848 n=1 Tax=Oratosquilla oratoria TaxID=337810 RepID=UPI003F75DBDA